MNKALQVKEILDKYILRQRMAKQFRLPPERELADQLGYSRSTIGKALGTLEGEGVIVRKKGSGTFITNMYKDRAMTIALVMRTAYHCTDTHFRLIVDEVSKYAEKNNIFIQIFDRLTDMFKEDPVNNSLIQAINTGSVDGVLIASRMPLSILNRLGNICPAVSINNVFGDGSEIPCVSCDYFRVGFLAGKHLLEKGHRRVAYLAENLSHPESTFDLSGFRSAFELVGVDITDDDVLETKQNVNIFEKRVADFFRHSSYTACFVRSSSHVSKMISVLNKNGITVPDDLSVISTGNYSNWQVNKAKLTVIDNRLSEMCHAGLQMVQEIIKNKKIDGGLKLLSPKIIENGSVISLNK